MTALKMLFCTVCGWTKSRGRGRPNLKCPKCGNPKVEVRETAQEPVAVA